MGVCDHLNGQVVYGYILLPRSQTCGWCPRAASFFCTSPFSNCYRTGPSSFPARAATRTFIYISPGAIHPPIHPYTTVTQSHTLLRSFCGNSKKKRWWGGIVWFGGGWVVVEMSRTAPVHPLPTSNSGAVFLLIGRFFLFLFSFFALPAGLLRTTFPGFHWSDHILISFCQSRRSPIIRP